MVYYMLGEPSKVTIATEMQPLTLPLIISAGKLRKSKGTSFYIGSGKAPMATEKIHGGLVLCWGQSHHGNRDNLII